MFFPMGPYNNPLLQALRKRVRPIDCFESALVFSYHWFVAQKWPFFATYPRLRSMGEGRGNDGSVHFDQTIDYHID